MWFNKIWDDAVGSKVIANLLSWSFALLFLAVTTVALGEGKVQTASIAVALVLIILITALFWAKNKKGDHRPDKRFGFEIVNLQKTVLQ